MGTARDEYPLTSKYDADWLLSLDMGPNPLTQAEALLPGLRCDPGDRVLDLGCGRGATSVFLARECDVEVTAFDLWVNADEIASVARAAGVADRIHAVQGDARALPFAESEFDAILSVDAFEYFGTDVRFLPSLLPVLKPGGRLAVSTPGLAIDPYVEDPPPAVAEMVGWESAAWHSPDWWQRHWELSRLLDDVHAWMQPNSHDHWLAWSRAVGPASSAVTAMLESLKPDELGIVLITARKR